MAYQIKYNGVVYSINPKNSNYTIKTSSTEFQVVPVIDLSSYLKIRNVIAGSGVTLNYSTTGVTINSSSTGGVSSAKFNGYTGTTAPATYQTKASIVTLTGTTLPAAYASKINFVTFTGTTAPATYLSKTNFNTYSASTLTNINTRLLTSAFNTYSGATGTRISKIESLYITGATNGLTITVKNIKLGGTLTGATTIDETSGTTVTLKIQANNLGVTQTDGKGLWFQNSQAAAAGAQQESPSITFEGRGWKTVATAASRLVKLTNYLLPVQGTTNPTGQFNWDFAIFTGASTNIMSLTSLGALKISGTASSINLTGGGISGGINLRTGGSPVSNTMTVDRGFILSSPTSSVGVGLTNILIQGATGIATNGTSILLDIGSGSNNNFAPTSGTSVYKHIKLSGSINQTGGANGAVTMLSLEPVYTNAGGNAIGIDYNPTVTSIVGSHYGLLVRPASSLNGVGSGAPTATWQVNGSGSNPTLKTVGAGTSTNLSYVAYQSDGTTVINSLKDNGDFQLGLSSSKLGLFGTTPILRFTTTGATATFVAGSGTAVNDASTFDGYTVKQVVKALRNYGLLS